MKGKIKMFIDNMVRRKRLKRKVIEERRARNERNKYGKAVKQPDMYVCIILTSQNDINIL